MEQGVPLKGHCGCIRGPYWNDDMGMVASGGIDAGGYRFLSFLLIVSSYRFFLSFLLIVSSYRFFFSFFLPPCISFHLGHLPLSVSARRPTHRNSEDWKSFEQRKRNAQCGNRACADGGR